jgi:hypothetical protein
MIGGHAGHEPFVQPQWAIFQECNGLFMQIIVRDNNVEQALRALKKKLQREGVYREMKLRPAAAAPPASCGWRCWR